MDTTDHIGENVRKKKTKGIGEKAGKKKTKGKPYLPDDIIPNILCRLPAKIASQCRLVCKGLRDLTLTQDFVDLHFRNSFPMIMAANFWWYYPKVNHFLLDKWWETARRKLMIHRFPLDPSNFHSRSRLEFSHAGLIVLREFVLLPVVIILNPINLEKITISISGELGICEIYGVFFHSSLREYSSLWRIEVQHAKQGQPRGSIFYKMLNLGSNPFLKTISNPFSQRKRRLDRYPLLIDKYLYWMLETKIKKQNYHYCGRSDIMQFDIIGEEFSVKPCPVPVETECDADHTHILNIDGTLSFFVNTHNEITIWRLKDHTGQLWTATNYTFSTANFCNYPKPIAVVDGKLALLCDRRLLVCDLMQGTVKCFRKQKYHGGILCLSHQVSLASLRNCHSTMYLDKNGDVDVRENSWTSSSSSDSLAGSPYNVNFEISSTDEEEGIIAYEL